MVVHLRPGDDKVHLLADVQNVCLTKLQQLLQVSNANLAMVYLLISGTVGCCYIRTKNGAIGSALTANMTRNLQLASHCVYR